MGSETVVKRISFRKSFEIFLRDFVTNLKGMVYMYFSVLHIVLFFVVN